MTFDLNTIWFMLVGVLLVLGIGWFFMRKIIFKRRFE